MVSPTKPASFDLMIRAPGWCKRFDVRVNGERARAKLVRGYVQLRRRWKRGDTVELSLDMPILRVAAHPRVRDTAGQVALQRGPVVYCVEECDHDRDVRDICLVDLAKLTARFDSRFAGGAVSITAAHGRSRIRAIPYCLWDNRRPGAMTVWLKRSSK
jgi:DUF1680 family protein